MLHLFVTALGGILAGLALAGALLWRQHQVLLAARHDATHDDTTGMPNRRLLHTRLRAAITAGGAFGVVLLDLDGFKTVNDTFGHDTGNTLLTQVGRRLQGIGGSVLLAARLSGDEFALLVGGDADDVAAAARAAWRAISVAPVRVGTATISVRASVGYACARLGVSARQILADADSAMYHAKRDGSGVCGHDLLPPPSVVGRSRDRHYR